MKTEKQAQTPPMKHEKPDEIRRDFLKRFGKYATTAPAVTFALMAPSSSKAIGSGGGEGGGGF